MKKERLIRLKSLLLVLIMLITLNGCKNEERAYEEVDNKSKQSQENPENITAVFFIDGKAMIYTGDEYVGLSEEDSYIADKQVRFSSGVEIVKTRTLEDAVELATAIVGEENIIYFDFNGKDMNLGYGLTK